MMKKIIILTICFLLLINFSYSVENDDYNDLEIDAWYYVTPWELQTCRVKAADDYPSEYITTLPYISQLTIAVQGEITDYGETTEENRYLYEVSYYILPIDEEEIFAVRLKNSETGEIYKVIRPTTASDTGASGYKAFYLNEYYNQVELGHKENEDDDWIIITVPIISNTGEILKPGNTGTSGGSNIDEEF